MKFLPAGATPFQFAREYLLLCLVCLFGVAGGTLWVIPTASVLLLLSTGFTRPDFDISHWPPHGMYLLHAARFVNNLIFTAFAYLAGVGIGWAFNV